MTRKDTPRGPRVTRRALLAGSVAAGIVAPATLSLALEMASPKQAPAKLPVKTPRAPDPVTAPPAADAADPRIEALVSQVSQERLRAHVEGLSAFPTRWSRGADFPRVQDWVADAFAAVGAPAPAVGRQAYTMSTGEARHNIVVGDPRSPRGVILIGAHMDSISDQPAVLAPGANDNATGIAAMLEARRILGAQGFEKEIVFVAFSGEEQDLQGSTACATIARREGWLIEVMINLDMLGHRPANPQAPIIIEYDQGNANASNNAAAQGYGTLAAQLAAQYSTLSVQHTDIWDSDYMPFESAGYACMGFYDDGVDAPQYHSSTDTAGYVAFDRLEQVVRILVALVATTAVLTA